MSNFLLEKFLIIPGILIVFTFHSFIRALIAYKLGDKSQKMQGNLSLDPFVHIDIIGFIMIVLAGFGWGKDAEINKYAFKNSKKDNLKVSLAGLFSFLIVAIVAAIITILCINLEFSFNNTIMQIITTIFLLTMQVAINLFVFNLIPMPGLDMFRILEDVKPKWAYNILNFVSQYQLLILLAIILLASRVLSYPNMIVQSFVIKIASSIFGIF
ncbi:site-2 protease family protein [Clostridium sp.]|uniref:site-2 protease family protein n=1 Tax=Clostridium sp. TaxID=1506 RepID=UPI003992D9F2